MRFYSKALIVSGLITVLFNSCKNDLKILAPYKDAMSVYGILNSQESVGDQFTVKTKYSRQYIRINKVFLGEGNAYAMAMVNDSVNYRPGVLKVTLTRTYFGVAAPTTVGNSTKMEIVLNDTVVQLSPGSFNSNQRLWFTDDSLHSDGEYQLKIKNTVSGAEFTSKNLMITSILAPGAIQPLGPPYYPVAYSPSNPPYYYLDLTVTNIRRNIKFYTVPNARDYACIIRFHWVDYLNNADSVNRTVDYEFSRISSSTLNGGEELEFSYYSGDYFAYLHSKIIQIPDPPGLMVLKRKAITIEYIITAAAQDFADFIKISAPSTSVAQDKPAYTNITGDAYGIFSCRSTFSAKKHLANATINYMATKKPLCDLLFLDANNNPGSVCN